MNLSHKYLTLDNDTYYLDGVEEVYIKYGSTVAFLSDVLEKKYLLIDDLIKNMKEVNTTSDDDTFYFHKPNKNKGIFENYVFTEADVEFAPQNSLFFPCSKQNFRVFRGFLK